MDDWFLYLFQNKYFVINRICYIKNKVIKLYMSIQSLLKDFSNLNIENNDDDDKEKLMSELSTHFSKIKQNEF